MCKNGYCRKILSEYRERTRKLYDDVDTLQNDIKDKDDFVQHVVKARNSLQAEMSSLEKKNTDLMDKNFELSQKIDQLDEDTDTGVQLLKDAHERERKLEKDIEEYRKSDIENAKQQCELKTRFGFLKTKFEKCLKDNQESSSIKEIKIKELQKVINLDRSTNPAQNAKSVRSSKQTWKVS